MTNRFQSNERWIIDCHTIGYHLHAWLPSPEPSVYQFITFSLDLLLNKMRNFKNMLSQESSIANGEADSQCHLNWSQHHEGKSLPKHNDKPDGG